MKKNLSLLFTILIAMLLASCSSDDSSSNSTVAYSFEAKYPEAYGNQIADNVLISLKNLTTNVVVTKTTDQTGIAKFDDLAPGNYAVTATKTLSEIEAEAITGIATELFLNSSIAELHVVAEGAQVLRLEGSKVGDWVIKEFYYSGAPNSYYFYDSFIEIYNNSTETLYADGLLIGSTKAGTASASSFYGFVTEGYQDAFINTMLRIPGNGTEHPVEAGKSIVIATDAINHKTDPNGNANSPVNLGRGVADFEVYYYVNPNTPDTDNPEVPNVEILYAYSTTLFDYIPGVMGSGLVIFRSENPDALEKMTEPNSTSATQYVRVPKDLVIDALEVVANATVTAATKRLPANLDAGMNTVGAAYSGTSLRRKVKQTINGRKVLLDTNNSSTDFEVNPVPSPKGW